MRRWQEAQQRFDAALDTVQNGMAPFTCEGEYVRVNDALCRLLGRFGSRADRCP
jgi:PAS domain-containing protein